MLFVARHKALALWKATNNVRAQCGGARWSDHPTLQWLHLGVVGVLGTLPKPVHTAHVVLVLWRNLWPDAAQSYTLFPCVHSAAWNTRESRPEPRQ